MQPFLVGVVLVAASCSEPVRSDPLLVRAEATNGPLRVSDENPRYFADRDGNVVYLTGAHTWSNVQDNGPEEPPEPFDYDAYLDQVAAYGQTFIRLWAWGQARWTAETAGDYWFSPMPYERTGPGSALDGGLRFDVSRLNQAYFDRLRHRVQAAKERGIYVSVMLFNGWSVGPKGSYTLNNPWKGHPFNASNNINGIDGDENGDGRGYEVQTLDNPAVLAAQHAYVDRVLDVLGDADNVLYEISNESETTSLAWQEDMVRHIRVYESSKGYTKHPVGMTVPYPEGDNARLLAGPADWISPKGSAEAPLATDGQKVILDDTDHLCGVCGDVPWVWKSFLRGRNPIFMDPYDGKAIGVGAADAHIDAKTLDLIRRNLGYTATYARRVDLARMRPSGQLSSSGYCLANVAAGSEAYLTMTEPGSRVVSIDLSSTPGTFSSEWFSPDAGNVVVGANITGGARQELRSPIDGFSVLYLKRIN